MFRSRDLKFNEEFDIREEDKTHNSCRMKAGLSIHSIVKKYRMKILNKMNLMMKVFKKLNPKILQY